MPLAANQPGASLATEHYDLVVIGGGINGCGIARDAAGRGYSVLLCEQHDLGAHTSSASTKLIHGGLRYLEHYQFSLVRKALQERERLLRSAPHLIRPLQFILPHAPGMRPEWMLRAGLFLYDHLAPRELLPDSAAVNLRDHPAGAALHSDLARGFVYSDGWVDDARLVVCVARDAAGRGARIRTRTTCVGAQRGSDAWEVHLQAADGTATTVRSRSVINAAGPWVETLLRGALGVPPRRHLRLVKGSHIVVPALFDHPFAYLFQAAAGRVIFAIPYQRRFTLIGTTEIDFSGDPAAAAITSAETEYLCAQANRFLARPVCRADVVWSFAGVRPLLDDANAGAGAVTRDYALDLDRQGAPLMTVFGGKLTTFRKLSEEVVDKLQPVLGGRGAAWTATEAATLPGGAIAHADFDRWVAAVSARHAWCPADLLGRWLAAYGTCVDDLLGDARSLDDLGCEVAPGLYAAELRYLRAMEWAQTADDILWRRSKLGLHYSAAQRAAVDAWLNSHGGD